MSQGPLDHGSAAERRILLRTIRTEATPNPRGGHYQPVPHSRSLYDKRPHPDADLAVLFGVPTKALNQAVKRNAERFPEDLMLRRSRNETEILNRSQIVTGHQKHRDPRFPPYAFTEHGAIMAATILSSPRAVEISLYVIRAFVRLRELLASNIALACKLDELERKYQHHDNAIKAILSAIRELMNPPQPKRPIEFTADLSEKR